MSNHIHLLIREREDTIGMEKNFLLLRYLKSLIYNSVAKLRVKT